MTNIQEYVDTSTGPGVADGRVRAGVRWPSAVIGPGSTVNEPWIAAPHAALSSNAQP